MLWGSIRKGKLIFDMNHNMLCYGARLRSKLIFDMYHKEPDVRFVESKITGPQDIISVRCRAVRYRTVCYGTVPLRPPACLSPSPATACPCSLPPLLVLPSTAFLLPPLSQPSQAAEGLRNSRFCLNAAGVTPSSARLFDAIASHCVPVVTPSLPPSLSLPTQQAAEGLRNSRFCLNAAGDTPSSARLFDAITSHCVPVVISNKIELPFETSIDYSDFTLFVSHEVSHLSM
ncbi:unnamed protein product [Closterium sp. NIES-53]